MKAHRKIHRLVLAVVAVGVFATIAASSALAKPPSEGGSSGACPSSTANFKEADNVGASKEDVGLTTTYTFESFKDEEPVGGVPGLIKYCVYPSPSAAPTNITTVATGANGDAWTSRKGSRNFSFVRPGGNKTNIPLDGETTVMGSATWKVIPAEQTILLHINAPTVCAGLYPAGYEELPPDTCFVLPGEAPTAICDEGEGSDVFAYNALPFDFAKGCPPPPSLGFEAQQTAEFGDEVELEGGGTNFKSLTVDFQSYGCSEAGHWNLGETDPCETEPGAKFPSRSRGTSTKLKASPPQIEPIATFTGMFEVPFRPSADPTNCPGEAPEAEDGSQWFDSVSGLCLSSVSELVTFEFASGAVPADGKVIWTVAFNTTNYGYSPIGVQTCNTEPAGNVGGTPPGCGYDSLNVGVKTYSNAPYAGQDVSADDAYRAYAGNGNELSVEAGWTGFTPLAQITAE